MSQLQAVEIPKVQGVTAEIIPSGQLKLSGTIAARDPTEGLAPFFRNVHKAVVDGRLGQFKVDVSGLTFVNSSAIRLFVDWVTWVKNDVSSQYKLVFVTDSRVTWQKTSLPVLKSLAPSIVIIEAAA
ncbi:MAG TPA: hypothetical protein VFQ61_34290 [Polyangiaceae bacterium]|nr:hypothetical protein [Polyangiaceae bacterium]